MTTHRPQAAEPAPPDPEHGRDAALLHELRTALEPEFQLIRHLGDESFGSLLLAREKALQRLVVLKVLSEHHAHIDETRIRFERAGLAAARLSHPNVVPTYRVGRLPSGNPFYVQPYVGDCTLEERARQLRSFTPDQVRFVLAQLASALAAAHRQGIVHRGLHPGAVRCEEGTNRILLTDFGLSTILEGAGSPGEPLTPSGEILGKSGYLSPEQMAGRPATDRSDVFALGLIGWRLLTGVRPETPSPVQPRSSWAAWQESSQDPALADLILRCLAEDPHDRPSAADVEKTLALTSEEWAARGIPGRGPIWTTLRRRHLPETLLIYGPVGWGLMQLADQLVQQGVVPHAVYLLTLVTVIAGLPASIVVAWHHGLRGRQRVTSTEVWLLVGILIAWISAVIGVCFEPAFG